MRLPYVPDPPPTSTPDEAAIVSRIQARRAPRPLTQLDLALLHAPPVADGWNAFLGAVRTRTSLPDDLRELAISRVAVVNRAWYEWGHHAPLAAAAGVPQAALDALAADGGPLRLGDRAAGRESAAGLSETQWAVVVLADEMTRNVEVADETFAKVKEIFGERGTVEVVATVACYNCVSRFLVALDGEFGLVFFLTQRFVPMPWLLTQWRSRREERDWAGCCALSPYCEAFQGLNRQNKTCSRTSVESTCWHTPQQTQH